MNATRTVKINCKGGIISPGDLYNILIAARLSGVKHVRFGLRQQLLLDVPSNEKDHFAAELSSLAVNFEIDTDRFPNIVSSYPAEEIFISHTWLSEGVYKDIFDLIDYQPKLKINISDCHQSFTPLLTGNINWVASPGSPHFWHLFIRFPKTNIIYEWNQMVYTNDVARVSREIERIVRANAPAFIANPSASGEDLMALMPIADYITRVVEKKLELPSFNLPYYEGLNRYHDKSWLGIYRRDELFPVELLLDICRLCLHTRIGQLCSTPWKSIIIKGIADMERSLWNELLSTHQVNVRHAANELNFQVEDNCREAVKLKRYLVKYLGREDVRTFGICLGIKMNPKSEIFSSVLIRRRPMIRFGKWSFLNFYDVLCARNFNPNERTGFVFSRYNTRSLLPEQLRRVILAFNDHQTKKLKPVDNLKTCSDEPAVSTNDEKVFQCKHCLSIYDESAGEPGRGVEPGTLFDELPADYTCMICDASPCDFMEREKSSLGLQPV